MVSEKKEELLTFVENLIDTEIGKSIFDSIPYDEKRLIQCIILTKYLLRPGHGHGIDAVDDAVHLCKQTPLGIGWFAGQKISAMLASRLIGSHFVLEDDRINAFRRACDKIIGEYKYKRHANISNHLSFETQNKQFDFSSYVGEIAHNLLHSYALPIIEKKLSKKKDVDWYFETTLLYSWIMITIIVAFRRFGIATFSELDEYRSEESLFFFEAILDSSGVDSLQNLFDRVLDDADPYVNKAFAEVFEFEQKADSELTENAAWHQIDQYVHEFFETEQTSLNEESGREVVGRNIVSIIGEAFPEAFLKSVGEAREMAGMGS
jgi:hypothetical protein